MSETPGEYPVSDDGKWRWDGVQWVPNPASPHRFSRVFRIGSFVSAGLGALVVLFSFVSLAVFFGSASHHDSWAFGYLGMALVVLSLAVLLATPLGLRLANQRHLLAIGALGVGIMYLGTCGGGIALMAAHPLPDPSPSAVALATASAPKPTPTAKATATPRPTPTPTRAPSPSPTPTPTPSPTSAPSPSPTQPPSPTIVQPFTFAQANLKIDGADTADIVGTALPGATLTATWGTTGNVATTADGNGKYDIRITGLPFGDTVVTVVVAGDATHLPYTAKTTITRTNPQIAIVKAYVAVVLRDIKIVSPAFSNVGTSCSGTIAECRAAMSQARILVVGFQSDLAGLAVPDCQVASKNELDQALALYKDGLDNAINGIDTNNPTQVTRGAGEISDGTAHLQRASSLVDAATCPT